MSALALIFFAGAFSSPSKGLADAAIRSSAAASPGTPLVNAEELQKAKTAAAAAAQAHLLHEQHLAHLAALKLRARELAAAKAAAALAAKHAAALAAKHAAEQAAQVPKTETSAVSTPPKTYTPPAASGGVLTAAQVGALWLNAGGPAWAESKAEEIAFCESGYNPEAYNPSGATGIWQILGQVTDFGESLTNPSVNAANAVAKFKASGSTFSAWVCQ
jgi:hypothetical protein